MYRGISGMANARLVQTPRRNVTLSLTPMRAVYDGSKVHDSHLAARRLPKHHAYADRSCGRLKPLPACLAMRLTQA
jgi:hypothetical protein